MKAILLRRTGDPSALEYVEVPTPRPGEGEVLVKADTIGISMPEVLVRKGVYAWMPPLPRDTGHRTRGNGRRAGCRHYRAGHRGARLRQRARSAGACRMLCRIHCGAGVRSTPAAAGLFARAPDTKTASENGSCSAEARTSDTGTEASLNRGLA